jgi:hypothetical protein
MNSIMRHGYKQDAKTRTSGDWTSYDALDEFEDVFDILILYSLGLLCFFFAQSKGYFYPKLLFISAFIGFLIIIILRLVVFIITMVNGFYIDRMDWVYILNSLLTVFSQVIATYPFAKYYQISSNYTLILFYPFL